jgi:hypothetical protein
VTRSPAQRFCDSAGQDLAMGKREVTRALASSILAGWYSLTQCRLRAHNVPRRNWNWF